MADHLAWLFATDETLRNCPFHSHFSTGGCRHGGPEGVAVRRDHPYRKIVQADRQEHFRVICFVYPFVCGTCVVDTSEVYRGNNDACETISWSSWIGLLSVFC